MHSSPSELKALNLSRLIDGNTEDFLEILRHHPEQIAANATVAGCVTAGYAPRGYELADFSIVRHEGQFHLFHIPRVPGNSCISIAHEHWLGHAVSRDLDTWVTRNPVLAVDGSHSFESGHLWAPFILEEKGLFYMFYTGLSAEPSQVLCLATCSDPGLNAWKRHPGNPLLPVEGFDWQKQNPCGHLRQGRDPHVVRVDDHWLLVYTTMHANGCPAVGGLVSRDLLSWEDIGPVLYRPLKPGGWMPESVNIQKMPDGTWVLLASMSPGLEVYTSGDPHAWHDAAPVAIRYSEASQTPAAPEILGRNDAKGEWLISFFETENNRLFLGVLNIWTWTLQKLRAPEELKPWLQAMV